MEPVIRVPIVHQVEEQIRKLIIDESYEIGQKLPTEYELCQEMGVSRGTIREAFKFLQAKGIVELKTGKGAFVADPNTPKESSAIIWLVENEEDLRNAIQVRQIIEPAVASLAAENASTEFKEKLESVHNNFINNAEKNTPMEIAALDEEFHKLIAESCGNGLLKEITRFLNDSIKTFRVNTFSVEENIKSAMGPHEKILQAIKENDAKKAEKEMKKHLVKIADVLTMNIEATR